MLTSLAGIIVLNARQTLFFFTLCLFDFSQPFGGSQLPLTHLVSLSVAEDAQLYDPLNFQVGLKRAAYSKPGTVDKLDLTR